MFRLFVAVGTLAAGAEILSAFPPVIPTDSVPGSVTNLTIFGTGFDVDGSITCHPRGGRYSPEDLKDIVAIPDNFDAIKISDSEVICPIPGYFVSSDMMIDLKLDGDEDFSSGSTANFKYRTLVEASFTRRPFLTGEDVEIILWPDSESLNSFPATESVEKMRVCFGEDGDDQCSVVNIPDDNAAITLPYHTDNTKKVDTSVDFWISLMDGDANVVYELISKRRRLFIVEERSEDGGSFVVIDHKRRMMEVNGEPFISAGMYVHSITEYAAFDRISWQKCKDDITSLATSGINHVQLYGLSGLDDSKLSEILDILEANGMHFIFELTPQLATIENRTLGFNQTDGRWEDMLESASRVIKSPMLLGWYVCDDCITDAWPLEYMVQVYSALRDFDPYHPQFGADWSTPWSNWVWGESGPLGIGFDVNQIENYHNDPYDLLRDGENRQGMFFEPLINSPPMYLIGNIDGGLAENDNFPAILEATLSFMSLITYETPSQINFIFGSYGDDGHEGSRWEHVHMVSEHARLVTSLHDALLPDLTRGSSLNLMNVNVTAVTGTGTNKKDSPDAAASVMAKGFKDGFFCEENQGEFCGYVFVVNLDPEPAMYQIRVGGLPADMEKAQHAFVNRYNVTIGEDGLMEDFIEGYGSNVLRFGNCGVVS